MISLFTTQIACQNQHLGHLASIYSRSEASFLANLIKREMITYSDVWIGLHDPTEVPFYLFSITITDSFIQESWYIHFLVHTFIGYKNQKYVSETVG